MTRRWFWARLFWAWAALGSLFGGALAGTQALANKQAANCNCSCDACPPDCAKECPPGCCPDCCQDN